MRPRVQLLDLFDAPISEYCAPGKLCVPIDLDVTATIYNNPGCAELYGKTVERAVGGIAHFTSLMIDKVADLYQFKFSTGLKKVPVTTVSPTFSVLTGQVYIPDDSLWNLGAEMSGSVVSCCGAATCPVIVAGEYIQSVNNQSARPFTGYKFPTVWVRRYLVDNITAGVEKDGWVDVTDWDFSFVASLPDPGCVRKSADTELEVCRQGLMGTVKLSDQEVYASTADKETAAD